MATTIVTKSGSGAPTASDLVAGELAVDLTNGRLYTEDSGGTVLELGLNPNGNVNVTGTVTADGTASSSVPKYTFAGDVNTGLAYIGADAVGLIAAGSRKFYVNATTGYFQNLSGGVNFGSGIDVTGTVTAGGLTVDGDVTVTGDTIKIDSATHAFYTADRGDTSSYAINRYYTAGTESWRAGLLNDATSNFHIYDVAGSASRLTINTDGNVGIGTTDLNGLKTVIKGSTGYPATTGTTQTGVLRLAGGTGLYNVLDMGVNETTDAAWIQATRANNLGVYDDLLLNPYGGNLLVGTTNTANLASATPNVVTDESFGINDGTNIAAIGVDRINFNAGQYYVLNETNDGVKLVNGATSWTTQSDENSKENIVELSSALTAVNAMRCVRYNLKSQTPDDVKIGFIAQDWQSSYPEVVATDTDGTLGMNYTETIPVLLKAIQELSAQNAALTARIAALES